MQTELRCPACGCENRETAKFCGDCGQPLATSVACGTQNPRGRRFCDECGGALDAPRREAGTSAPSPRREPDTLADGRYQLQRFLGEGAKKRTPRP